MGWLSGDDWRVVGRRRGSKELRGQEILSKMLRIRWVHLRTMLLHERCGITTVVGLPGTHPEVKV